MRSIRHHITAPGRSVGNLRPSSALESPRPGPSWPPNVSVCLYRIIQEALHNVARHSHAPDAHVPLASDAHNLTLHIADSGVGFDTRTNPAGLALVSMRERAVLRRGEVVVDAFPSGGTESGFASR